MSINVADARLDVYLPGNDSTVPADADAQVSEGDFEHLSVAPRIQDLIDTGTIEVRNTGGEYTDVLRSGARLEVYTQIGSESSLTRTWTGLARNVTYEELGALDARITIDVDDFVFGMMDVREVVGSFDDRQISGTEDAIVETLLRRNAPEIDRSQISTFTETETVIHNGEKLLNVIRDLARRVNSFVWAEGKTLRFEPLDSLTSSFTLGTADRGLAKTTVNDDEVVNQLRIYGSNDSRLEDEVTVFDSFTTVTSETRELVQITTRKSEVAKVELWTDPLSGSEDDLVVRIHPNTVGGSSPVEPDVRESDYAQRRLSQEFLSQNGWTTFLIPEHNLVNPDPWIIVEASGSEGQQVGIDAGGTLLHKHYYPFPTDFIRQDIDSISTYRKREGAHLKRQISSRTALANYVDAVLARSGEPNREYSFPAQSERAFNLTPGDVITVPANDRLASEGDHIITLVDHTYDGSRLHTAVTAQDTETV